MTEIDAAYAYFCLATYIDVYALNTNQGVWMENNSMKSGNRISGPKWENMILKWN